MTTPIPPSDIPKCGTIQPDGKVKVKLAWTISPDIVNSQDLWGWPSGVSDSPDNAVFGSSMFPDVSSFEVIGLEPDTVYYWKIITDGDLESDIAWFRTESAGPIPPTPEHGGLPTIAVIGAGGILLLLLVGKRPIHRQVPETATLLPPKKRGKI